MLSDIFFHQTVTYTRTEQEIIDFYLQKPRCVPDRFHFPACGRLGISDASLSRLAKHAGYPDYKGLKAAVTGALSGAGPAQKLQGSLQNQKEGGLYAFLSHHRSVCRKRWS